MSKIKKSTLNNNQVVSDTIDFQKLSEGIYALNYKKDTAQYKFTREQIQAALDSNNEQTQRNISNYFYNVSGEYKRIIDNFANLLLYPWLVIPRNIKQKYSEKNFNTAFDKVMNYMQLSHEDMVSRFITKIVLKDGVCYTYERIINNDLIQQQLPSDYCRSRSKVGNGIYSVEFNLKFFDLFKTAEEKLDMFNLFPDELLEGYINYIQNPNRKSGDEWLLLNPEFTRCHKMNELGLPPLSPVFTELISLSEYKALDKTQTELDLYKILIQKIPLNKEGKIALKEPEIMALHKNAKKMITQNGVNIMTTACDVEAINLQEKGSTLKDNIAKAIGNVYQSIGTSNVLFGEKDVGAIGLAASLKVDESFLYPLLDQYKLWYENKINNYIVKSKNYYFVVKIFNTSINNQNDQIEMYKGLATLGASKLPAIVVSGINQSEFNDLLYLENEIYKLPETMIPLSSSYNGANDDAGRPTKSDDKISETTAKQRNNNTNKNRGLSN